ncbi:MAG: ATP-binding protein [bacterium]|nr:ATP-binding protein [bacterium]
MDKRPWYVIAGGPCAGKTTLLMAIKECGYQVIKEAARAIIEAELQKGKTLNDIRGDEFLFQQIVLREKIATEQKLPKDKIIFFDRGIPDTIAYYKLCGVDNDIELNKALEGVSYKKIFLLDMIDYVRDNVRTETPEQARYIHTLLEDSYRNMEFPIIKVPVLPIPERVKFILDNL